ncbi:glycerate kinase [Virgibacillus sp. W0430]|uniref:glycerate kinase n=1 Tax=Virgibacillus sp. W0430 TaxID=3391580 RepID=UPI003F44F348
MKIVIAPDSFKGSLSSLQASKIMKQAIKSVIPSSKIITKPMADGGEGTLGALLTARPGKLIPICVSGPLGEPISTTYAIIENNTAIIECAAISGLVQVPEEQRNPDNTTSYGIGEVIKDALDKNCTELIIGLGGSAVNDGGLGMLQALGLRAKNDQGTAVGHFGKDVHDVTYVDFSKIDHRLSNVSIKVASDVDNPLCGKLGATFIYGPQKGATPAQLKLYDRSMKRYGSLIEAATNKSLMNYRGAGSAGGLGFALLSLGAHLVSGAELLAKAMQVEEEIKTADLVLTGEGQSDEQTLYGKAPGYIAFIAQKHKVPVVLLSGSLSGDLNVLRQRFSGCFSITNKPLSLTECMENADTLLYEQTKQVIHLIHTLWKV